MYKIGELSRLCKLPVKTLRYYDSEGLITPDCVDPFTGYRYYAAAKLTDCYRIIALKELGFTLSEIKQSLHTHAAAELTGLVSAKQAELHNALLQIEFQLRQLDQIKQLITEGGNKMFDVIIRNSEPITAVFTRKMFNTKQDALSEIDRLKESLPAGKAGRRTLLINYETEYCESDFDLAACVEIIGKMPHDCDFQYEEITFPLETASLVCAYDEIEDAYRFLIEHIEEVPCQIIGAFYEIYHADGTVELKVPVCRLSRTAANHKDDTIDLPFENDANAIGKWQFLDIVPCKEQFVYGYEKSKQGTYLNELYFLPGGEGYWCISRWSKGYLYTAHDVPKYVYKNKYTIEERDGHCLLFLEMKNYETESRGGMPALYIYEKVSDQEFSRNDLRISDNTDLPFVSDPTVPGRWKVCDFTLGCDDFNPEAQNYPEEYLFLQSIEFKEDGKVFYTQQNGSFEKKWTKGFVLDTICETASAYHTMNISGIDYLFIEWKSGDYLFGGTAPYWYILMPY